MDKKCELIYEGKAKIIFANENPELVSIVFKDDATAFNAKKKQTFKGKGILNCSISSNIFDLLIKNKIPTHYIKKINENSILAKKVEIIPIEVVLRNIAYGSLCKQIDIEPGTNLKQPLIDFYYKNDNLNDPLLTSDRIFLLDLIDADGLQKMKEITYKINNILKDFFLELNLTLVDFKLEFGKDSSGQIILADEFSPDNCRLWDRNTKNGKIESLDKDRFRNDLGDLIEAYSEIDNRINNFIGFT